MGDKKQAFKADFKLSDPPRKVLVGAAKVNPDMTKFLNGIQADADAGNLRIGKSILTDSTFDFN